MLLETDGLLYYTLTAANTSQNNATQTVEMKQVYIVHAGSMQYATEAIQCMLHRTGSVLPCDDDSS